MAPKLHEGCCAQRRPESEPRRHPFAATLPAAPSHPAQRRPESEPRRHRQYRSDTRQMFYTAQRRPESEPRRHRQGSLRRSAHSRTLNEGRSLNPGDTHGWPYSPLYDWIAQRRPESEPRRHRSAPTRYSVPFRYAQRRPESEPRRHNRRGRRGSGLASTLNEGRSLNPGDTQICTPPSPGRSRRSTKAGV